jgi:dipeptidyl aminopeptidase/acylaminoacyl peptidase
MFKPTKLFILLFINSIFLQACQPKDNEERESEFQPKTVINQGFDTISPSAIAYLQGVSEPKIAPDGKTVAYVLKTPNDVTYDTGDIWTVSVEGKLSTAVVTTDTNEHAVSWVGTENIIAFLMPHGAIADKSDKVVKNSMLSQDQLWFKNLTNGELTRITEFAGGVSQYAISPNGKKIALMASNEVAEHPKNSKNMREQLSNFDVWILDIESKGVRRLSSTPILPSVMSWSPDGTKIAIRFANSLNLNDVYYFSKLSVFDVLTGKLFAKVNDRIAYTSINWAPNSQTLVYHKLFEGGVHYEPRLFDITSKRSSAFVNDKDGLMYNVVWNPKTGGLMGSIFTHTAFRFVEIDQSNGSLKTLFEIGGGDAEFSVAKDNGKIAFLHAPGAHPADIYIYDGETTNRLTDHNPHTESWNLGDVKEVKWTSSIDKRTIYGVLVTPLGWDGGEPLRLVVQVHGGPEWYWTKGWSANSWHDWSRLLASEGIAVLLPNQRGSDGQGADFTRAVMGDWMGSDYQDIIDGVNSMVAKGVADPDHLGIGGWSYGGYTSAWSLSQDDIFKAVVIGAPMTNLRGLVGSTDTPYYPTGYLGTVIDNSNIYEERSPVIALGKDVTETVLMLHTDKDVRVPLAQSMELFRLLEELDANVEFYVFKGEGHWVSKTNNEIDLMKRVVTFYKEQL